MACNNEVLLYAKHRREAERVAGVAIAEVKRIEAKYSRYRTDSLLSKINGSAGKAAVEIDRETAALLNYANQCFEQSGGLFDATSGVLRRAWDYRSARLPKKQDVDALRALVGWPMVEWDSRQAYLTRAGMELDFGGFGKEYAVDRACDMLVRQSSAHALVNLGGDLRAIGAQADGSPWRVGIQHPRDPCALLARVDLRNMALATSGDYERFMLVDGKRYSHILNPATGWPVFAPLQSVSVKADICLLAGSLTTIALLKGESDGLQWLHDSGSAYLAVRAGGEVEVADGSSDRIPLDEPVSVFSL